MLEELIVQWGAVAAGLTAIISFSIWVYKKLVAEPDKRVEERLQKESNRVLKDSITPLINSIDKLNHILEDSRTDIERLYDRDRERTTVLDNHETRITVIEKWKRWHEGRPDEDNRH